MSDHKVTELQRRLLVAREEAVSVRAELAATKAREARLRRFRDIVLIRVERGQSLLDFGKGSEMANALSAALAEKLEAT